MKQNLIIVSAGRLGREMFSWASQCTGKDASFVVKGFLDDRPEVLDGFRYPCGILGDAESYEIRENDVFIGAIGDPLLKERYYTPLVERGARFISIVHPTANVGEHVELGSGVFVGPFTSISTDVRIGDHVSIMPFCNITHDVVLGKWSQLSGHVGVNGGVVLGERVFVGSHGCFIPRVKVGDGAVIGAGAVVIRDVPPNVTVVGNPGRILRMKAPPAGT